VERRRGREYHGKGKEKEGVDHGLLRKPWNLNRGTMRRTTGKILLESREYRTIKERSMIKDYFIKGLQGILEER